MEYYKALGLGRNATKGEIKEAFRKLALQFHPDKHSSSPKSVRDGATLRFKQASEAYEVLIDDHKRAHYDRSRTGGFPSGGNGYGYHHYSRAKYYSKNGHGYGYSKAGNADGFASKFEIAIRFLTTRAFLLNAAFVGILIGGSIIIDTSRDALWKMHNPGCSFNCFFSIWKSFEEAMESIEKGKAVKDKR